MNHIDHHTLELYVLQSDELPLSARQIDRHLGECAGCRDLYQEIVEYYRHAARRFEVNEERGVPVGEAIARRTREPLVQATLRANDFVRWEPGALSRLSAGFRRHPAAVGMGTFFLGATIWALLTVVPGFVADRNPTYAGLNPGTNKLEVYNESNEKLWEVAVTGIEAARGTEVRDHLPSVVVLDLDGDGQNEVVATLESVGGFRGGDGAALVVFSANGKIRWREAAEHPVQFRGEKYPHVWLSGGMLIGDFDGDGKKEIICRAFAGRSPSAILRFGIDGKVLGEYWHFGHLTKLGAVDLCRKGRAQLLAGGSNDADGEGDFGFIGVTLLDPGRISGKTEATLTPGFGYPPSTAELACVRLPNTPVNIRYHSKPGVDGIVIDSSASEQAARVWWVASVADGKIVLEYIFGPDLVLKALKSSDATIRLLTNLRDRGEMSSRDVEEFLPSLRPGVEYWDGGAWRKEPHLFDSRPE